MKSPTKILTNLKVHDGEYGPQTGLNLPCMETEVDYFASILLLPRCRTKLELSQESIYVVKI